MPIIKSSLLSQFREMILHLLWEMYRTKLQIFFLWQQVVHEGRESRGLWRVSCIAVCGTMLVTLESVCLYFIYLFVCLITPFVLSPDNCFTRHYSISWTIDHLIVHLRISLKRKCLNSHIRNAVAFVFPLAALSFSRASLDVVFFLSQLCRFQVARSVPLSQP